MCTASSINTWCDIMELILTQNEIEINYSDVPVRMILEYRGSFIGEVFGDSFVDLNRNRIILSFQGNPPNTIMSYRGDWTIGEIKAYNKEGGEIYITRKVKEDKWNLILSDYANNTNKYTDYNKSINYENVNKTLISYKYNNKQYYANEKGMVNPERNSMELKKLNRIRSKYGIK